MGMTHIRLAEASEDVLYGALRAAWKLRVEKSVKSGKKERAPHDGPTTPKRKSKKTLRRDPRDRSLRPENLRYKAAAH